MTGPQQQSRELWPIVAQAARQADWRKAGSIRVLIGALIPAAIAGWLASLVWAPLVYVWIPVFAAWWLFLVLLPSHVLYCPYCSKRVKMGATACHHCGRDVLPGPEEI